jgi:ornithine cyclodeaminase
MRDSSLLVIDGATVADLLAGRERDVVGAVTSAYLTHRMGASALPHSQFLRFPEAPANRIIALPAYLGGVWHVAGVKWIASFPANVAADIDRASAVMVLNSADTGLPYAILEGAQISAQRTAASAALAARHLWQASDTSHVAIVGCGVIAYEIARFLHLTVRPLRSVRVYDVSAAHARDFVERCTTTFPESSFEIVDSSRDAIDGASLIVLATTAGTPHLSDASAFSPGATVLHVSLRDLTPALILAFDNIVDDPDHVCRAETSVHLAERLRGDRRFIRATIADIAAGAAPPRLKRSDVVVFSPFGLGVLDLAIGYLVAAAARSTGSGLHIPSFLPPAWRRSADVAALVPAPS